MSLVEIEQASAALYGDGGFTEGEVPARKLTDIVALTRDHNVRVAEADHVVAGYTAWRDEAPGVGVITTIAVHPDFQRVGVGSKLIETIRDEARDAGLKHLVIRCRTKAHPMWKSRTWSNAWASRSAAPPASATWPRR